MLSKNGSKFALCLLVIIAITSTFVLYLTQQQPKALLHQSSQSASLFISINFLPSVFTNATPSPLIATTSKPVKDCPFTDDFGEVGSLLRNGRTGAVTLAKTRGVGYWVGLHFSDQGTGAFLNMMSFLCLSSFVGGVRIVEPFAFGSNVGQKANENWTEQLPFSDVFDADEFNYFARSRGFSSLVPYSTFLADAPRKLLVAQYKCDTKFSRCRTCGHGDVLEQGRQFSKWNGFEMVGHVCLDYNRSNGSMTLDEFQSQLYSTYNRSEVVVLFPLFAGVTKEPENFRLIMSQRECLRSSVSASFFSIRPSKLVETSADNYIDKYLKGGTYVSVMVRLESIVRPLERIEFTVNRCLYRLHRVVKHLKTKYGYSGVALSLDVGIYGSLYFREFPNEMDAILPSVNRFISKTVERDMTLSDWEGTFTNTTLRQNPGFVAIMQKAIAARGELLVLVGEDSSFQKSAELMFIMTHPKGEMVIHLGKTCW